MKQTLMVPSVIYFKVKTYERAPSIKHAQVDRLKKFISNQTLSQTRTWHDRKHTKNQLIPQKSVQSNAKNTWRGELNNRGI